MKKFRLIIAGNRFFDDYEFLCQKVDSLIKNIVKNHRMIIVSGACDGADSFGEKYAKEKGFDIVRMPANWSLYGKKAGPIRNKEMALVADGCVCFLPRDKKSKGTKDMIRNAKKEKILLRVIEYYEEMK